jgi:hypothetical protein
MLRKDTLSSSALLPASWTTWSTSARAGHVLGAMPAEDVVRPMSWFGDFASCRCWNRADCVATVCSSWLSSKYLDSAITPMLTPMVSTTCSGLGQADGGRKITVQFTIRMSTTSSMSRHPHHLPILNRHSCQTPVPLCLLRGQARALPIAVCQQQSSHP